MSAVAKKVYITIINTADKFVPEKFRPLWEHPAGPKTIFFWAPTFKWGLVFAGLGDLINRPPELISVPQTTSLVLTGLIWSRYSLVITPVNYNLLSVNFFVALTQGMQLYRALTHSKNLTHE